MIEVENKTKKEILKAIEKEADLSPYRADKEIIIEEVVVL